MGKVVRTETCKEKAEIMQCKQCGTAVSENSFHKVADWIFCPDCFERLLRKSAESAEKTADTASDDAAESVEETAAEIPGARCSLCEKPLAPDMARDLGIWQFCPDCMENLTYRPPAPQSPEEPEKKTDGDDDEPDHPRIRTHIRMEVNPSVRCDGCGRQITARGSKEGDGKRFCPECFYSRAHETSGAEETGPAPDSPPAPPKPNTVESPGVSVTAFAEGAIRCECCNRPILPPPADSVEGFFLCRPCLTTDPESALEIAGRQHKRRLAALKAET